MRLTPSRVMIPVVDAVDAVQGDDTGHRAADQEDASHSGHHPRPDEGALFLFTLLPGRRSLLGLLAPLRLHTLPGALFDL
jgi:hypothetical protein